MNNLPQGLSPEIATWMMLQAQLAASRAVERLEVHTRMVDDFSEGILELLTEVVPELLRVNPSVAVKVMPLWRSAMQRQRALAAGGQPTRPGDSEELLDARVLMFNQAERLGVWQAVADEISMGKSTRAKRRA